MKKISSYAISLLAAALFAVSCSKEAAESAFAPVEGQGAASIELKVASGTRAYDDSAYPWNRCAIRICKYVTDQTDGTERTELIRRYNSRSEMPAELWLVEGRYNISVELGSKAEATFTEKSYAGSSDFEITEGATTHVSVDCRIINTIVEVVFDPTIPATFKESYDVTVAASESFDAAAVADGSVLSLNWTESKPGYFILPAETTAISWRFYGLGEKDGAELEIDKTGTKTVSTEPGMRYLLTFRYSKDLGGYLDVDFSIVVDQSTVDKNDDLMFVPDLQIDGEGFDITQTQEYLSGGLSYEISAIGNLAEITVGDGTETFTIPASSAYNDAANGISTVIKSETEIVLTLGDAFFARFGGGEHLLTIRATDANGSESEKESRVRTQGIQSFAATDCWNGAGRITAIVFDPSAADVKIRYRKAGAAEWNVAAAVNDGADTFSADVTGIGAGSEYEIQLLFGEQTVGAAASYATGSGAQIHNAGFETWTGTTPLLPYTSEADQWWDSGNHGSSTLRKNVTTNVQDARPGSSGSTSAELKSQFVGLGSLGKFAAGNIFIGKYFGTDGTNGIIGFGKPFAFDYRPKALAFWYKGNIGTIDRTDGTPPEGISSGKSDIAQVYICLCKMDGPHVVATKHTETFLSLPTKTMSYTSADLSDMNNSKAKTLTNDRTDGKVIACGIWEQDNSMQYPEWTKITVPLTYYEEYEGEVPTYLMLTASASKYGDYFTGSTESVMYLDDVELVY